MFRPSLGHPQALKENIQYYMYVLRKRLVGSKMLIECYRGAFGISKCVSVKHTCNYWICFL